MLLWKDQLVLYRNVIVVYNNKENLNKLGKQNAEIFMLNHIG